MARKSLTSLLAILVSWALIASAAMAANKLSPKLRSVATSGGSDSLVTVVIFLEQDTPAYAAKGRNSEVLGARASQQRVKSALTSVNGTLVRDFEQAHASLFSSVDARHWIVPALTVTIQSSRLNQLSIMPGIRRVVENAALDYEEPVKSVTAPSMASGVSDGLNQLNVGALWALGYTGKGRLVCSFDTGVEGTHPALASKWRGASAPLSETWFSKINPAAIPFDAAGHGTHTMGVMVGSVGSDTIGVAPDAEWISAGVIDQPGRSLSTTISDIIEAFEWALDPDGDPTTTDDVPDVILNSWGIPKGLFEPCDDTFYEVVDAVEAAGVVTIFACGNEGPEPMTLRSPADRASTPLNSFTVGAVDPNYQVASFSSRGPSSCDQTQIKPEVVAPGVLIRSSFKDGTFKFMSGTSMAAPFVAGLVALMRQYNPAATVDEIKNAMIQSAIDVGAPGQDNASGHGFIDVTRLLEFLPAPPSAEISLVGQSISGDNLAMPGETIGLTLVLTNPAGNVENVTGTLVPRIAGQATVQNPSVGFFFGTGGTNGTQTLPFTLQLATTLYHGQKVEFDLLLQTGLFTPFDTLPVTIRVGLTPAGEIATVQTNDIDLTISEFGQYGLAEGSIYDVNGDGFTYQNSANLLYEGGIIVARNALQMSTAVRGEDGTINPSDFVPTSPVATFNLSDGGNMTRVTMRDYKSIVSIPVEVRQESVVYDSYGDEGFVIVRYILRNVTAERLTNLRFGFVSDFDLPSGGEQYHFDPEAKIVYQTNDSDPAVGIVALSNIGGFTSFSNGPAKRGFTNSEWLDLLSSTSGVDTTAGEDRGFVISTAAMEMDPGDSVVVAFALIAGADAGQIINNAEAARQRFFVATSIIDDNDASLPDGFSLGQNYPNPFNPTTTIAFELTRAAEISLEVFNVRGQKVVTLIDGMQVAGSHEIEWDATSSHGNRVASGVYFYRLRANNRSQTKQMVVLK